MRCDLVTVVTPPCEARPFAATPFHSFAKEQTL